MLGRPASRGGLHGSRQRESAAASQQDYGRAVGREVGEVGRGVASYPSRNRSPREWSRQREGSTRLELLGCRSPWALGGGKAGQSPFSRFFATVEKGTVPFSVDNRLPPRPLGCQGRPKCCIQIRTAGLHGRTPKSRPAAGTAGRDPQSLESFLSWFYCVAKATPCAAFVMIAATDCGCDT